MAPIPETYALNPAPMRRWLLTRLEEFQREESNLPTDAAGAGSVQTPNQRLLVLFGWDPDGKGSGARRLHRWLNEVEVLDRRDVEEALLAADVDPGEVYPELAVDVAVEPDAYCGMCREDVTPIDGVCPWCDAPVGVRPAHSKARVGQNRLMTDAQLRAAYEIYRREGLSLRALAERIFERYGYANADSCSKALGEGFKHMSLEARDRIEATRAACTVHGRAPRRREDEPAEVTEMRLQHRRELRRGGRPRCPYVSTKGTQCRNLLSPEQKFCSRHDEAGRERNRARLEAARAAQRSRPPMLSELLIREAIRMHTRDGLTAREIGRALQPRTRSKSVDVIGRLVLRELRTRGVYQESNPFGRSAREAIAA